jgi:anti-anti-sigma regulatory factor
MKWSKFTVRVTIQEADKAVTFKIEGRAAKPLVAELRRAWQTLAPSLGARKLWVDLRGVTFMDTNGRRFLADIHAKTGAEFIADSPLTKYYAEEAVQAIQINS